MEIYDVTGAVVDKEEAVLALFDNRYNSVMIIKPEINNETGKAELEVSDPDGAERLFWLEKFGMITPEEFQEEAKKIEPLLEKRKLIERLKKDIGEG